MADAGPHRNLVNAQQLAVQLGVSESTVYRLVTAGHITPLRVGARYRFDPDAVTAELVRASSGEERD